MSRVQLYLIDATPIQWLMFIIFNKYITSAEMPKREELLRVGEHLEEGVRQQEDKTHHHH